MDIKLIQKLQEEDLFPNASKEEVKRREEEIEKTYPEMDIYELMDTLYSKAIENFEEQGNFDRISKSEWITNKLMQYKGLTREEANKIKLSYLQNIPIPGDKAFNEVFKCLGDNNGL